MVDTLKLQGREQSYGNHHHFMDYATTHILRVKIKEKSSILLAWEKKSILKHAQSIMEEKTNDFTKDLLDLVKEQLDNCLYPSSLTKRRGGEKHSRKASAGLSPGNQT